MSDPDCIRIAILLKNRELSVSQIGSITNIPRKTLERRLAKMRECSIIQAEYRNRRLRFQLSSSVHDQVSYLLSSYEETMNWDPQVASDLKNLERELGPGVVGD